MALEDFEKSLADAKRHEDQSRSQHRERHGDRRHHRHKHRHQEEDRNHSHRHKRRKHSVDGLEREARQTHPKYPSNSESSQVDVERQAGDLVASNLSPDHNSSVSNGGIKRDSWMEESDIPVFEYVQKGVKPPPEQVTSRSKADFELKIHENELNKHHLQGLADGIEVDEDHLEKPSQHSVNYTFGDAGASWRMTKLKGVYRRAEEERRDLDDVAREQYGDLESFDDAREEQTELDRRETYGDGYVGKEKPSGELFAERKITDGIRKHSPLDDGPQLADQQTPGNTESQLASQIRIPIDQTALNRLKAQMLKAQIRGGPEAATKTTEYNDALAGFANHKQTDTIVLGTMENRMLAGGRQGEVKMIDNKRGKERGLVEENEDMTIEDMVREERRTRGQAGGDGRRFAERIAKDGKFDNDLDYMDENATKLAKRVQKSEINLRNTAITEFQKTNRILDTCPLCHHEDTSTPPVAPIISLATRVYLTLPTVPEISDGGAFIIPIQHRTNLLECDDDEWEEIRNFMKSLTRMYHDQGRDVIFYENAAAPHRRKHAGMEVVPLPYSLGETAPAFFKEAILAADEEWTQHKKIIDTMAKSKSGLGKSAFRRTLVKEMPYFHVWFDIDGGLGHIVEDSNRWPKGDLFAREIIGGMLDQGPDVIKRRGRWGKDGDPRTDGFQKRWRKFDWTRILTDG